MFRLSCSARSAMDGPRLVGSQGEGSAAIGEVHYYFRCPSPHINWQSAPISCLISFCAVECWS